VHAETKLKVKGTVGDGQLANYSDKWNLLQKFPRPDKNDGTKTTPWFDGVLVTEVTEEFLDELRDARWKVKRNSSATSHPPRSKRISTSSVWC